MIIMETLPGPALDEICQNLSLKERASIELSCKKLYEYIKNKSYLLSQKIDFGNKK